jgi:hypothetical protein
MSGVFKILTPPTRHCPASVYPPAFGAGGGHTRWVERGWGLNILKDARHCSVLYIRKYFVLYSLPPPPQEGEKWASTGHHLYFLPTPL